MRPAYRVVLLIIPVGLLSGFLSSPLQFSGDILADRESLSLSYSFAPPRPGMTGITWIADTD
jgi:hypothetical protein